MFVPCPDGSRCIDEDKFCNCIPDCFDGSDEFNCIATKIYKVCPTTNACIPEKLFCDGKIVATYPNGADEWNCDPCPDNKVPCTGSTSKCIDRQKFCDGKVDCPDQTDENNCSVCPDNRWKCTSKYNVS